MVIAQKEGTNGVNRGSKQFDHGTVLSEIVSSTSADVLSKVIACTLSLFLCFGTLINIISQTLIPLPLP